MKRTGDGEELCIAKGLEVDELSEVRWKNVLATWREGKRGEERERDREEGGD